MAALLYASRLPDAAYEIVLVASNDPQAGALALAEAEGVPTFALSHKGMDRADHDAAMDAAIRKSGAEFVALAGYMRILGDEIVGQWAGRMLNIHPSLLPLYTGLETHKRAIEAGDSHGGASVHLVIPELDSGEVLGQVRVAIQPGDTPATLAERVKLAEHQLYPRILGDYVSRGYDSDYLYARVADLALALPEAEEKTSHGSPGFRTGGKSGKFFAHFNDQHHGVPHISVLAKTSGQDELLDLIERDPDTFYKPAYYGASGWVGIILNRPGCDWDQVAHWLERSWASVAPKRLTKLREAAAEF
ncbi:formyltransferase family protein [Qipengyuania sp. DSG2-2]|uniref:formyltransferase family protein n=1 Tax=Qipengyuania sp. DGS2-2 TaxID=3349631 RepID=UPI0036D41FA8